MFDSVLKFILLASVTIPNIFNADPLRAFESKFFFLFSFILFASSLISQPQRNIPRSIYLIAYSVMAIAIINILTHGISGQVLSYCSMVFCFVVDVLLIITYLKKPEECFKFISIGVLFNVIVYFMEQFDSNPILIINGADPGGLLGSWPRLTIYFALALPFVYKSSPILLFNTVVFICLVGVDCKQITVLIPFYLVLLYGAKNNYIRAILLIIASCAFYSFYDKIITSFGTRFDCWLSLLSQFFDSWYIILFGNGLGFNLNTVENFKDPVIWSSHLQFILNAGIFSLCVYDYCIHFFIKNRANNIQNVAVLNLFIISCIEYPFEILRYWPTIAFIFGAYFIKTTQKKGEPWNPF